LLSGPNFLHAQVPQNISYQAVINDSEGNPVEGTIGVKITILKDSAEGENVYSERHSVNSDANGLISIRIGETEEIYKGQFDTIDWSAGPYFAKVEISPTGGYLYSISTINELLSVPFALYALRADSVINGYTESDPVFSASAAKDITAEDTVKWNSLSKKSKLKPGLLHEGGIVFYVDPSGEHGLLASLYDIADQVIWAGSNNNLGSRSSFNGADNTIHIVSALGTGDYAAYYCDTLSIGGYTDWYLPSSDELFLLFKARYYIDKFLEEDNDEQTTPLSNEIYWSSTEVTSTEAIVVEYGSCRKTLKSASGGVRAIRSF
jgi:hypothetical protein